MAQPRKKTSHRQERRFTVRGVRRDPVDMRKLSKALIGLAIAEAEREAQAEREAAAQHGARDQTASPQPDREGGERDG